MKIRSCEEYAPCVGLALNRQALTRQTLELGCLGFGSCLHYLLVDQE